MGGKNGVRGRKGTREPFGRRFKVEPRMAHVVFDGTEYDGLEMYVRLDITMDRYLTFKGAPTEENQEYLVDLIKLFGDQMLDSWNLDGEDGEPIPATGDNLMGLPIYLCLEIIKQWLDEVAGTPAPLEPPSSDGLQLAEVSTSAQEG